MIFRHQYRLLLVLFLWASYALAADIPETCLTQCVTPYGEVIGKTSDGVVAYSNCKPACVVFQPANHEGTYTGIKWHALSMRAAGY